MGDPQQGCLPSRRRGDGPDGVAPRRLRRLPRAPRHRGGDDSGPPARAMGHRAVRLRDAGVQWTRGPGAAARHVAGHSLHHRVGDRRRRGSRRRDAKRGQRLRLQGEPGSAVSGHRAGAARGRDPDGTAEDAGAAADLRSDGVGGDAGRWRRARDQQSAGNRDRATSSSSAGRGAPRRRASDCRPPAGDHRRVERRARERGPPAAHRARPEDLLALDGRRAPRPGRRRARPGVVAANGVERDPPPRPPGEGVRGCPARRRQRGPPRAGVPEPDRQRGACHPERATRNRT